MEVVAGNDEMVNGTSGEWELQEWIDAQIEQVQAWDAEITLRPARCPELAGPMLSAALRIEQAQRTLAEFRARKMAGVRSEE